MQGDCKLFWELRLYRWIPVFEKLWGTSPGKDYSVFMISTENCAAVGNGVDKK